MSFVALLSVAVSLVLLLFPESALGSSFLAALAGEDELTVCSAVQSATASELNKKGQGGQTPLMASVLGGKTTAVKCLLTSNLVDVTIGENDGYTPMHGAGFQGRAAIAKLLIEHGIPVSAVHEDGFAPIHRACWGKEQR